MANELRVAGQDRPQFQVVIDGRDVTRQVDTCGWSSSDPGGFEACQIGLSADQPLRRGAPIVIRDGVSTVFMGRKVEAADQSKLGRATRTAAGEGARALLRDDPYQEIYVDCDLRNWTGPSMALRIANPSADYDDGSLVQDPTGGVPVMQTGFAGAWGRKHGAIASYDSGGIPIGSLYYAWKINPNIASGDANWSWLGVLDGPVIVNTGELRAAGPGSGTLVATAATNTYAYAVASYAIAAGTEGMLYAVWWTQLAVYGRHGLPLRGAADFTTAQGFYPSDIARHALTKSVGIDPGVIVDSTGYITPQAVYREPTASEKVIDDQANLLGWHWGVWEPATVFGDRPQLDFRPPPADATCSVSRSECEDFDITAKLSDLYDTARVTYNDVAGASKSVTVTVPNPLLLEAGITAGRVLPLNMGIGTQAGALTLGRFALLLSQSGARGAGSATLPASVRLPGGGRKPAHLLKPGIDRIRVTDLTDAGPITETDNRRRDVFRISRLEVTVDKSGTPKTHVELDTGANLLEVLVARLAVGSGLAGF